MNDNVQVTVFLRPDTTISTFDRQATRTDADLRIVGVLVGDATLHIAARDDAGLIVAAGRLIEALSTLRLAAIGRLVDTPSPFGEPDPTEPTWRTGRLTEALDVLRPKDPVEPAWWSEHQHDMDPQDFALDWTEAEKREAFGR